MRDGEAAYVSSRAHATTFTGVNRTAARSRSDAGLAERLGGLKQRTRS